MIQEYLFVSYKDKTNLEDLIVPEKVIKKVTVIDNSECWIFSLSVDSESEDAARLLDSFNTQICEKYKPIVLSNECSAYFNKSLFPTVNEFERKLRKLLYLASALQGDSESQNVISDLETKDLGEIFTALFSDANFVKRVKECVNQKTWQFTRNELLATLEEFEENTLWEKLLGNDCVKTLCKCFAELRTYRNDVMHAHNINYEIFKTARNLFKKVNSELDSAIEKLIGAKKQNVEITLAGFNSTLSSALAVMQSQVDISNLFYASEALRNLVSNQPVISTELSKLLSQIGQLNLGEYILKPEVTTAIADFEKIAALQDDIAPAIKAMNEVAKQFATYKIDIPPAVTELQEKLSEIDFGTLSGSYDAKHNGGK